VSLNPKTGLISVRVPAEMHRRFLVKSRKYGGISLMMRELVSAFNEDRIKIEPPKLVKELYTNE